MVKTKQTSNNWSDLTTYYENDHWELSGFSWNRVKPCLGLRRKEECNSAQGHRACVGSRNTELWLCGVFRELQTTTAYTCTVAQVRWRSQVVVLFSLSPGLALAFAQLCDSWIRNSCLWVSLGQTWLPELALGEWEHGEGAVPISSNGDG